MLRPRLPVDQEPILPASAEVDFFHRRPSKRHIVVALAVLVACGLIGRYFTTSDRQQVAAQKCVQRALASFRRTGLSAQARVGPGAGRPRQQVVADLCTANADAF